MSEHLDDQQLRLRFQKLADEIADGVHPGKLIAPPGSPVTLLSRGAARRRARSRRLTRRGGVAVAAAVVVLTAGAAYAASRLVTVPINVIVTGPNGQGLPSPLPPGVQVVPGTPQVVTFAQAQAAVPYPILVLPPSLATPEQWQLVPPTRTVSGGPVSPDEVMEPQIYVVYQLVTGATVDVGEYPGRPGVPMSFYVKWYGASGVHHVTFDGYQLLYDDLGGSTADPYLVAFKTVSGLQVQLAPAPPLSDLTGAPTPVSLSQFEELVAALSPAPAAPGSPATSSPQESPSSSGPQASPSASGAAAPSATP